MDNASVSFFLKDIVPFNLLKDRELAEVLKSMELQSFQPGDVVIKEGIKGNNFYIIMSGLAKVFLLDGSSETVLAFLGDGDCFGEISLLTDGPTTSNVVMLEQTACLMQSKEDFLLMTQEYPIFYKFFNQLLTQRMRTVYKELLSENPGVAQVEPFLYRKQVRDIVPSTDCFIDEKCTIEETARKILEKNLGPVIVTDDQRRPKGIVGLKTISKAVLLEGIDGQSTVENIMERDFHSIDADSYFFDALHGMIKYKTNILVVMDKEKVEGMLSGFDLLRFRGREGLSLLRNIESTTDIAQLNAQRREVEKVLRVLMGDGALASQACKIVSEFNDKMVRRVIELTEMECGSVPAPYVWLGLGSEGRMEQTLFTDQDNGIIFSEGRSKEVRDYFTLFSARVVEGLNQCGIPLCKGGVMATSPKYFGGLDEWKTRAAGWILAPNLTDKELMDTYVFLDFRGIYGDQKLEKELKSHVVRLIEEAPAFLRSLAEPIVSIPVPLGFFKNFIVEKSGIHKDRLNVKLYGLVPLVTCVKILSLQQGIIETNTLERIRSLSRKKVITKDQDEILEQAFETFLTLKIRNNLNQIDQGRDFGNHISPAELSTHQKQLLREAFWGVSELQKTTKNMLKVQEFGDMR